MPVDIFGREMGYRALVRLFVGQRHRLWGVSRCRGRNGLLDIAVLLLLLCMLVDRLSIAVVDIESGISRV